MRIVLALSAALTLFVWLAFGQDHRGESAERTDRPAELPPHRTEMVAMRDGVRLATDIYLPEGDGPWAAVVARTPYDRKDPKKSGNWLGYPQAGYALVIQDWRGTSDSEGRFSGDFSEGKDGYDTVEWIARQPWCNGKVGVVGGSASGIAAKQAILAAPPHLAAAAASVSASRTGRISGSHGGVIRGGSDEWTSKHRFGEVKEWPKPRTFRPEAAPTARTAGGAASRAPLFDGDGWFDLFFQGALDDFVLLDDPNNRLTIGPTGHTPRLGGLKYPSNATLPDRRLDWLGYWLKGEDNGVTSIPRVRYYLMGDVRDPGAPGNVWKQADAWPIPSTPTSYFFSEDGGLRTDSPAKGAAFPSFAYDPNKPVPTIGGAEMGPKGGPQDQRPLKDRVDILRFATEPLTGPLEVTGRVFVELFIDTDVPDTTFMAKLIDVYPDGYEALMLDSAIMARYWNGFDNPAPLEKGRIYKLTIDLLSTALVFNKGHRIAVHVAGSNSPRYEVHPNSYEPVNSYDNAPVAHNRVHVSSEHPSCLILPVIAPGASKDYAPRNEQR